jgi:poly(3-hydroxybutyrate) depolymerase
MGHGTPISADGVEGLGEEGKYMLEVGISSTRHIADFWGLTQAGAANAAEPDIQDAASA